MSTEKTIRSQSLDALKGNWTVAVSGLFVVLGAIILTEIFYSALLSVTGIVNDDGIKKGSEAVLIIILCFVFLFSFALSPFKNGFFRLCYNISCGRSDGVRDVFYFFSGTKKYFKALQFNAIIMLKTAIYAVIGFIPYILCRIFEEILFRFTDPTVGTNTLFETLELVFIVLGVIITIILSVRLFIPEFVFVDNFEANTFDIAKAISKKHLKDYYKLALSFVFWILLCFFVLPVLYVVPYFTTSLGTTSKWLINLYKEGKMI